VHQFTTHQAECAVDEKAGIAVHEQGYASRAVTDKLAAQYPRALPGLFNVGILHTALDGQPLDTPDPPRSCPDTP
jgi:DNA repair protein SbcD/Mre11